MRARLAALATFALAASAGCSVPSSIAPTFGGSVGLPHNGFLTNGKELPKEGKGYRWKSAADHHYGLPRVVALLEESAEKVADARPGSQPVYVGDISARGGGALMPKHRSHRTGRDVDILFYMTTLEGVPIPGNGFVKFGPDGLGVNDTGKFVRFDVERQWLFIRALLDTKHAHVQWIFISRILEALVIERAIALGEPPGLIARAETVMQQPGDSLPHDDHIHVRVACESDEFARGCDGGGPSWAWLPKPARRIEASTSELVESLLGPTLHGEKSRSHPTPDPVRLLHGDNLVGTKRLIDEGVRCDLLYADPPFGVGITHGARTRKGEQRSARTSVAYDDAWDGIDRFLEALTPRLALFRALLSPRGTLYLHLDHRAVHESKLACDVVFGRDAFRGEIVWAPGNGARTKRIWGATHQTILVYTEDARRSPTTPRWIFHADDDALREPYAAGSQSTHFRKVDADGRRYRTRTIELASGPKTYRYHADRGRRLGTVWTDVPAMAANTPLSEETTGYPHQKPEKLLERLVRASSDEGSLVIDPFCGSGTTMAVAARLGRRAIGLDAGTLAIETTRKRLEGNGVTVRVES